MGVTLFSVSTFPLRCSGSSFPRQSIPRRHLVAKATPDDSHESSNFKDGKLDDGFLTRRSVVGYGVSLLSSSTVLGVTGEGMAVVKQGLLAGRVPGLSDPDEQGWRTYRRPDEKSGGHGVGWSPIIPYAFSVPQGWEEVVKTNL
ncbi:unnamed protein product [Linum tenue]|uniref:Chlorophyll a-b binding protein, chloroplastic n=1 Tax=Linum tenue TaxID=586396 RepID=A0AAV0RY33_9ROSI|nr:unnamed protein product [Linum tenue]